MLWRAHKYKNIIRVVEGWLHNADKDYTHKSGGMLFNVFANLGEVVTKGLLVTIVDNLNEFLQLGAYALNVAFGAWVEEYLA